MEKYIIVALADNRAIGKKGQLPWHLGEDLKYFKRNTMGCPVIMGRTTFESLGKPLPGRKNIVLSRSAKIAEGAIWVESIEAAFREAEKDASAEKCFIIGGAQIYAQTIDKVDKLYLTLVHTTIEDADAFFPEFNLKDWKEETRSEVFTDPESGLSYEFILFSKV